MTRVDLALRKTTWDEYSVDARSIDPSLKKKKKNNTKNTTKKKPPNSHKNQKENGGGGGGVKITAMRPQYSLKQI